jgi:hypothetical protein
MFDELDDALALPSSSVHSSLLRDGYSIVDQIFSHSTLTKLRDEMEFLHYSKWMEPSGNLLQQSPPPSASLSPASSSSSSPNEILKIKPNVYERSLVLKNELVAGQATMSLIPTLAEFWSQRQLFVETLKTRTGVALTALDQIKVAVIEENGAFMIHTDKMPQTSRIMTMTLYLNHHSVDSEEEGEGGGGGGDHGGQLRLYPLVDTCCPKIIDVDPIFGRAVLFSSTNLPHRVMPSRSTRYCISFFFYGTTHFPLPSIGTLSNNRGGTSTGEGRLLLENIPTQLRILLQRRYPHPQSGESLTETERESLREQTLEPIITQVRSRYCDLCPLIHQQEYCRSILEAFSSEEEGQADPVVIAAVKQFAWKCEEFRKTLDEDLLTFVDLLVEYLDQNKSQSLVIQLGESAS